MRAAGVSFADVTTFTSMALAQRTGLTRLAQIRAVTPGYPFYGQILTSPAGQWAHLQEGRFALVDPALLIALDAHVGDTLALGFARFIITGTLTSVPGDVGVASAIGPRIYIPQRYVDETSLLLFGSRSDRETLVKLPPTLSAATFLARLKPRLDSAGVRSRTVAQTEFNLTQAIDQLRDFLGVIGLVSLLLGGIGVASGVNAFVMRKIDTVAILRCLGATSRQVLAIYLLQAVAMGLLGAAAGAVLGIAIQLVMPHVLAEFLPVDVRVSFEPTATLTGLLTCSPSSCRWTSASPSSRPPRSPGCSSACGLRWCSRCVRSWRCATCRPCRRSAESLMLTRCAAGAMTWFAPSSRFSSCSASPRSASRARRVYVRDSDSRWASAAQSGCCISLRQR
jgi:putative ABC transport system permease protein